MDFPTAWKASSIVLTGAFGILGLVKDYKNKETNRLTRWGTISLAGIIISTLLGVVAQLQESSDNADKALALARKSDSTLRDIEKALSPIEDPQVSVQFRVDCDSANFKLFCTKTEARRKNNVFPYPSFEDWPQKPIAFAVFDVIFYADKVLAERHENNSLIDWGNMTLSIDEHATSSNSPLRLYEADNDLILEVVSLHPFISSDGVIQSALDLPGSTVFLRAPQDGLVLKHMQIKLKSGRLIHLAGPYRKVSILGNPTFVSTLPNTPK
jgi:hypothetical protein